MTRAAGAASSAFRLVVIASSAGGLSALVDILSTLPADFPVPLLIVQHIDPTHQSQLWNILSRRTVLQVKEAADDDVPEAGHVYVAPADRHVTIEHDGIVRLSSGALVRFVRPSADVLFSTAATNAGGPIIGVVLTGTGSDGAQGARAIKSHGGVVIAQDQASSQFFGMPQAAIDTGSVDYVLPLRSIGGQLCALTRGEMV